MRLCCFWPQKERSPPTDSTLAGHNPAAGEEKALGCLHIVRSLTQCLETRGSCPSAQQAHAAAVSLCRLLEAAYVSIAAVSNDSSAYVVAGHASTWQQATSILPYKLNVPLHLGTGAGTDAAATSWQRVAYEKVPLQHQAGQHLPWDWQQLQQLGGATWFACVPITVDAQLAGMLMVVTSSGSARSTSRAMISSNEASTGPLRVQDLELIAMFLGQSLFKGGQLQAAATTLAAFCHAPQPDIKTLVCNLSRHMEEIALAVCGLPLAARIALMHTPSQQMVLFSKPGPSRRSAAASSVPTPMNAGSGSTSRAHRLIAAATAAAAAVDTSSRSKPVRFSTRHSQDDVSRSGSSSLWGAHASREVSGLPDVSHPSQTAGPASGGISTRHVSSQLSGLPRSKYSLTGSGVLPTGVGLGSDCGHYSRSHGQTETGSPNPLQEDESPHRGKASPELNVTLTFNNTASLLASAAAASARLTAAVDSGPHSTAPPEPQHVGHGIDMTMASVAAGSLPAATTLQDHCAAAPAAHMMGQPSKSMADVISEEQALQPTHVPAFWSSTGGYLTEADSATGLYSVQAGTVRCGGRGGSLEVGHNDVVTGSMRGPAPKAPSSQRQTRRGSTHLQYSPSAMTAVRRYASVTMPPAAEAATGIPDHLPLIKAFTHQASAADMASHDADASVDLPLLPASWPTLSASMASIPTDMLKALPSKHHTPAACMPAASAAEALVVMGAVVHPGFSMPPSMHSVAPSHDSHTHTDMVSQEQTSRTHTGLSRHRLSHVLSQPPQIQDLQDGDGRGSGSSHAIVSDAAAMLDAVVLPVQATILQRALNYGKGVAIPDVHKVLQQRAAAPYRDVLQLSQAGITDLGALLVLPYMHRQNNCSAELEVQPDHLAVNANSSRHARRSSGMASWAPPDALLESADSPAPSSPRRSPNATALRAEAVLAVYMLHPYPLPYALLKQLRSQLGQLLQLAGPLIRERLMQGAEWHTLVAQLQDARDGSSVASQHARPQQSKRVRQGEEVPRSLTFPSALPGSSTANKSAPARARTNPQTQHAAAVQPTPADHLQLVTRASNSHAMLPAPEDRPSPFLQSSLQSAMAMQQSSGTSDNSTRQHGLSASQLTNGQASVPSGGVGSTVRQNLSDHPKQPQGAAAVDMRTHGRAALPSAGVVHGVVRDGRHQPTLGKDDSMEQLFPKLAARTQSWSASFALQTSHTGQTADKSVIDACPVPSAQASVSGRVTSRPARSTPTSLTHLTSNAHPGVLSSMGGHVSVLGPELSLAQAQDAGMSVHQEVASATSGMLSFRLGPAVVASDDNPVQVLMAGLQKSLSKRRRSHMLGRGDPMLRPHLSGLLVMERVGRGAYGTVYRGMLDGQEVAVKVVPAHLSHEGGPHRVRASALQHALELAVGSIAMHPNLVQVVAHFTNVRVMQTTTTCAGSQVATVQLLGDSATPLPILLQPSPTANTHGTSNSAASAAVPSSVAADSPAAPYQASVVVMEYCDGGSMVGAICRGAFKQAVPGGWGASIPHMPALIATLLELAVALRHLHGLRLLHGDVKASNVLLRLSRRDARGFTTKLGDLGLVSMLVEDDHGQLVVPSHAGSQHASSHSHDSHTSLPDSLARDAMLHDSCQLQYDALHAKSAARDAGSTAVGGVNSPAACTPHSAVPRICTEGVGAAATTATNSNAVAVSAVAGGLDRATQLPKGDHGHGGLMVLSTADDELQQGQSRETQPAQHATSSSTGLVSASSDRDVVTTPTRLCSSLLMELQPHASQQQHATHQLPGNQPVTSLPTTPQPAQANHAADDPIEPPALCSQNSRQGDGHDLPCGQESSLLGTLTHMAPEVLAHDVVHAEQRGAASDVYSFGILMAELVMGCEVVYLGLSSQDIQRGVQAGTLRPLLPDYVPEAYRQLAARCWAQQPSCRPSSGELVAALKVLAAKWPLLEPATPASHSPVAGQHGHSTPSLYGPHWYATQPDTAEQTQQSPSTDTTFPLHIL